MTDLLRVLPNFPVGQYASLIPSLEKHAISTSDLLTLDAADIGKRTQLPLLDIKRLSNAVLAALHTDVGVAVSTPGRHTAPASCNAKHTAAGLSTRWQTISLLDATLDSALGGGIPAGYVTEITGESGAGKTQFLLTLLLAVQLPPPHGLGKTAMYISTEAALSTRRLSQIMSTNPTLRALDAASRPSLDNILSQATPDLESQDHILTFQVPITIERRNVGLLVLDSVAANFRAEFERSAGQGQSSSMAARTAELVRLGMQLRELARKYNIAVVVANQVADRFGGSGIGLGFKTPNVPPSSSNFQSSPLATRSKPPPSAAKDTAAVPSSSKTEDPVPVNEEPPMMPPPPPLFPEEILSGPPHPALILDHQQRWFTGWGDERDVDYQLKTPSLGLVWSTQISSRIALFKRPYFHYGGRPRYSLDGNESDDRDDRERQGMPAMKSWKRWMKVVFAPHAAQSGPTIDGGKSSPVEFEVTMGGVKAIANE
ncbi:hypothetical protein OQA88_12351 [Cercophora sp. LCS_1]